MPNTSYGTPYVASSDLVSAYPTASLSLANRIDEVSYRGNGLNAQTGTSYTLVVGDAGKTVTLSNAAAVAVTLPQDSVANLPTGSVVSFYNLGAGTVTISQGAGATLQGGSITLAQFQKMTVIKLSANTYGRFDAGSDGMQSMPPTSIANSGGSASLSSNTVTFTTVNSVSLNGCFNSTYDNYRVVIQTSGGSGQNNSFRLRASGTDATTNYDYFIFATHSGLGTTNQNASGAGSFVFGITAGSSAVTSLSLDLWAPNQARNTGFGGQGAGIESTLTWTYVGSGSHKTASAYDGFTFFPASGTLSGTISVYGYRK